MRIPYKPLRNPRSVAVVIPLIALPPAPITPMTANWDAPEKVSKDRRQVCRTENPAATLAAPKAAPYVPTVRETLSESLKVARREVLDTTGIVPY